MIVSAIIPAAGRGLRMKSEESKPFLTLCGRPILAWTLDIFERCQAVDDIVLVVSEEMLGPCRRKILEPSGYTKVRRVVAGGNHRQDSVYQGLMAVPDMCDIVVVHDGARPLVHDDTIRSSIRLCLEHQAVITATPPKETIKQGEHGFAAITLDRSKLWSVQTPQTFSFGLLRKAHESARQDGFVGTDDASLVERLGEKVKILEGSYDNIKITTVEDVYVAEKILEQRRR